MPDSKDSKRGPGFMPPQSGGPGAPDQHTDMSLAEAILGKQGPQPRSGGGPRGGNGGGPRGGNGAGPRGGAKRPVSAGPDAEELSREVMAWIDENLEPEYPWPGNYRELEQCIKNVLIRRDYRPSRAVAEDPAERFAQDFQAGRLTAEQFLSRYCGLVYRQTGSYEETARRLKLDRRTVKSRVLANDKAGAAR